MDIGDSPEYKLNFETSYGEEEEEETEFKVIVTEGQVGEIPFDRRLYQGSYDQCRQLVLSMNDQLLRIKNGYVEAEFMEIDFLKSVTNLETGRNHTEKQGTLWIRPSDIRKIRIDRITDSEDQGQEKKKRSDIDSLPLPDEW